MGRLVEKVQYQGKLMKVVIAFDIDGTVDTSSGPVTVARMKALADSFANVWIVSPSGLSPNRRTTDPTKFKEAINGDRVTNLRNVKQAEFENENVEQMTIYLYVSDNKDYDAAKQAGFSYIEASQFV